MLTRRKFVATTTSITVSMLGDISASANTPRKLLFVHGRSQEGRSSSAIKQEWSTALNKGISEINHTGLELDMVEVPFYGDELERFSVESRLPLASSINARGNQLQDEFLTFQEAIVREIAEQSGVTDQQIDREYGDNPRPRGPQNWEWLQAIIRAIDSNFDGITQDFLETFLRDVFLYTSSKTVQRTIDTIVHSKMTSEPTVVIAHSLGSVVMYNILKNSTGFDVPLFVTLGSPLGIRGIRDKFAPIKHPSSINRWFNAFDDRDVVALYPLDKNNFNVTPEITNFDGIKNQTKNRHGIVGYLDKKEVVQEIINAWGRKI